MGVVEHNWMELGFGRTSTTSTAEATPRNLLGFKDGTRNIKAEQTELMNQYVWVGPETDQAWLRGGSYLVARKIRMFVENWDRDYLQDQENVIGRSKVSRRTAVGRDRVHRAELRARGRPTGEPAIPSRRAHPAGQPRAQRRHPHPAPRLLVHRRHRPRRGHAAGRAVLHRLHAEPVPVHQAADSRWRRDALNEYIQHTGSAVFACPPGPEARPVLGRHAVRLAAGWAGRAAAEIMAR